MAPQTLPRSSKPISDEQEAKLQEEARDVVKDFLESSEGSSLRAWLLHFDSNNDQKISLSEFNRGMAKMNFTGDSTALFAILDQDKSGELSLEEIDGANAFLWQRFRNWCVGAFEHAEDMFKRLSGQSVTVDNISRELFKRSLPSLGWDGGYEDILFSAMDSEHSGVLQVTALQWLQVEKRRQRRKEQAKRKAELNAANKRSKVKGSDAVMIEFKGFLKRKYGSYIRAWRKILSPDGNMTLQKADLFKAVARVGWQGDVRALWSAFDKDDSGYCSVEELDARNAMILAHFKQFIDQQFGSSAEAFRAFDKLNRKKLKQPDFCAVVKAFGFKLPTATLFTAFDIEGAKSIMEEDMRFLDRWKPPAFLVATANYQAAEEVKAVLLHQFKTYLKAWRQVLDADDSNHCNWGEFSKACKKINYNGDVAGAWRALDEDLGGFISLQELDPASSKTMADFKTWCDEEFGGIRAAFGVFDNDGSNEVTYREFRRSCRIYGYDGNVHTLFHALDTERSGTLTVEEVAFLDEWVFAERGEANDEAPPPTVSDPNVIRDNCTISYMTDTPGPASYETRTTMGAGPMMPMVRFAGAYTFRKRLPGQLPRIGGAQAQPSPAPGHYNDVVSSRAAIWRSKPSYGFGSEKRAVAAPAIAASSNVPGPGQYAMPPLRTRTQHAICTPRRPLKTHPLVAPGGFARAGVASIPQSARL